MQFIEDTKFTLQHQKHKTNISMATTLPWLLKVHELGTVDHAHGVHIRVTSGTSRFQVHGWGDEKLGAVSHAHRVNISVAC